MDKLSLSSKSWSVALLLSSAFVSPVFAAASAPEAKEPMKKKMHQHKHAHHDHASLHYLENKLEEMRLEIDALKAKSNDKQMETSNSVARETQSMRSTAMTPPKATQATKIVYEKFNTEVRVGGRVKLDTFMDLNGKQPGNQMYGLDPAGITLRQNDFDARRTSNYNATLVASRISLGAKKEFQKLTTDGYLELDFNGNSSRTTNSYTPRIRHAYVELTDLCQKNDVIVGQTWTTFSDVEASPFAANNQFPSFRQAQVRYTRTLMQNVTFAVAAEKPNTQYYQYTSANTLPITTTGAYLDNDSTGSNSKSSMPDFTAKLKYQDGTTLFSLRGVVRRLSAKTMVGNNGAVLNFNKSVTAWGLGVTAMYRVAKPITLMGQIQGGKGIGRYIDDLAETVQLDSYLQYPTAGAATNLNSMYTALSAINFMGGFTVNWCNKWESNAGVSYTKIHLPKGIVQYNNNPGAMNTLNRSLQRYFVNLIYTIVPKSSVVLEVNYAKRKAGYPAMFKGENTRFTLSFIHNF